MIDPPVTRKSLLRTVILALVVGLFLAAPGQPAHAGDDGGSALDFDGTNDYVSTGTASSLNMSGSSFTIELWIWGDSSLSYSDERLLVEYGNTFDVGTYQLTTMNDGNFKVNFHGSSGDGSNANVDWSDSQWHHLAGVFDNANNELRTYFDGALQNTTADSNAPGDADLALYLASRGGTGNFSDVIIDDVRIWNTARTASEIRGNMFSELAGSETGLVAYYKLNEGSGTGAADATANNNDGTLSGSPTWLTSTAPFGTLVAQTADPAALWGGQTDTASDGQSTGLDIADVSFLNETGDDIVFGHNNAAFANVTTDLPTSGRVAKRWARVWELDVNDVNANGGNVGLTFDISDAGGTGNFSDAGTYYLLKRLEGSSDNFTTVGSTSPPGVQDQLTFTVDVSSLGSEFTLGGAAGSPTAVGLHSLSASSGTPFGQLPDTFAAVLGGLLALVTLAWGGLALARRRH